MKDKMIFKSFSVVNVKVTVGSCIKQTNENIAPEQSDCLLLVGNLFLFHPCSIQTNVPPAWCSTHIDGSRRWQAVAGSSEAEGVQATDERLLEQWKRVKAHIVAALPRVASGRIPRVRTAQRRYIESVLDDMQGLRKKVAGWRGDPSAESQTPGKGSKPNA